MNTQDPIIRMEGIVKDFPGVRALSNVNFKAYSGEVLALCGGNGAGKSTLMKILSGVYSRGEYSGNIYINGKLAEFTGTNDAEGAGITIIHQELNLFPELSVAENIFINRWSDKLLIDWDNLNLRAEEYLKQLKIDIQPTQLIKELTVGKQQMVEIAKALSKGTKIIIFDEPTSALSEGEKINFFKIIQDLKKNNVAIIYISHKIDEIKELADRIAILRDGETIGPDVKINDITIDQVITKMVGRDIKEMFPKKFFQKGEKIFEVKNFSVDHPLRAGERKVENANFSLHTGEVLGIFGLMGSGRTELVSGIFGAFPKDSTGEVFLKGKKLKLDHPATLIKEGVALVSEDRKLFGLILDMSIKENITMASLHKVSKRGFISEQSENEYGENKIKDLNIKATSPDQIVSKLSGGNQQKVVLAKWLMSKPKILILDEPTRGIDVGAKIEIYNIINSLVESGVGVIMVSSDLHEIIGMSDRVLVMRESSPLVNLSREEATQERIMEYATCKS